MLAKSETFELEVKTLTTEKEEVQVAMKTIEAKYIDLEFKFGEVLTQFESYIKDQETRDEENKVK